MAKVTVSMSNQHNSKTSLLHVATLGRTIGLKGDMNFIIKTDFPEQFKSGATFLDAKNNVVTLENVNLERETVRLKGIQTPEAAKKYVNTKLFTTFEETRESCHLEEGEFFWFDIVGCSVVEEGRELGVVQEIERMGVTDYLSIATQNDLIARGEAKTFLLPYHPPFIKHTDITRKVIEVSGAYDILQAS
jgi:16S rRNA processing protein RimM